MILDAFTHRCHAEVIKWAATQIICYNILLANMLEGNPVPGASKACFLLEKPNIFLDSSVGRAPDC